MPDDDPLSQPTERHATRAACGWTPPSVEEAAALFPGYEVLRLLRLLGRGGMGAVYQARQIELDRLVAIKLLPLEVSADRDFADRFRREARAMAKLNHPNIIAVYDFGTTSAGHLFFVMEFVEGANLHDIIRQVGLAPDQVLSVATQICTALAYAHGKGIVHRDIKPANVMIDTDSHVKVADFGLARLTDPGTEQLGHTMTGTVMGTPDYMAPEQMRGMNVDHRADIYSLGVMLYEMLCGEVPKGIFDPPSARTGCDPRIDQIVVKAMQQVPDRRYQSTQEMKTDVLAARRPAAPAAPRVVAPPPRPLPAAVPQAKSNALLYAGIAAAAVAVIGSVLFFTKPNTKRATTVRQATPAAVPPQPSTTPAPKPLAAATAKAATPVPAPAITPAPTATSGEKWVDGLAELWAMPAYGGSGVLVKEAAGTRLARSLGRAELLALGALKNVAIRATLRTGGTDYWSMSVRRTGLGGNDNYYAGGMRGGQPLLRKNIESVDHIIRQAPPVPGYAPERSNTVELRVHGELLTMTVNGQIVAQARDDTHREKGNVEFFAKAGVLIEKLEYCDLGADPPAATTHTAESWRDWMVEAQDMSFFAGRFEKTGSRFLVRESGGLSWEYSLMARDMAVRATWQPDNQPPLIPEVMARTATDGTGRHYAARVLDGKVHLSERRQSGGTTSTRTIQEWPLPAGFDPKAEQVLELRVVGDLLTVRLNAREIGSARDNALTHSGTAGAFATKGTIIRQLEYLNLDPPASTAASQSAIAEKWQDLIAGGGWPAPWIIENGVLTRPAKTMAQRKWEAGVRDCAWRVTRRWDGGWYDLQLGLRSRGNTGLRLEFLELRHPDQIYVRITSNKQMLGEGRTARRYQKGDLITIEFRAVDTRITASINDELVASAEETTTTSGAYDIWTNYGEAPAFHKVEFLNLDGAAKTGATTSVSASPTLTASAPSAKPALGQWVNLLAGLDGKHGSLMAPWTLENGALRSPQRNPATEDEAPGSHQMFAFPVERPARSYDLRYRLTRNARGFAVAFPFVRDGAPADLRIDGGHGLALIQPRKPKEKQDKQWLPVGGRARC